MRKNVDREELIRQFEKETVANIELARPVLEKDLYKFNKFVLKVEKGEDMFPLASVHKELCRFVDIHPHKKKLILVPRSHLKSTIITIGKTLQAICANPSVRILIANATYNLSCSFLTEIKRHLKNNKDIQMFWGELAKDPETWSASDITLSVADKASGKKEPTVTAMGLESNMTSQHYDKIILDDLVNKDYINTQEQIEKTISFYKECLNLLEPNGELIVVGTRWHDSDLYGWIMDPENSVVGDFDVFLRKAYEGNLNEDEGFSVLFPGKFTRLHLKKLREQQGPYVFSTQYLNDPIPDEDATFRQNFFKYYEPLDLRGMLVNTFTAVDPAISLEKTADYTGIVTASVDQFRNIYIREIVRKRLKPSGIISELFRIWEQFHPIDFGLEDVAYQKALQYSLSEEMQKRQVYLPVKQVKPQNRSKDQRIKGLQPLYFNGKVYHAKITANIKHLEDELLRFPVGKHDDVIDAFSYLLDFMYPPRRRVSRGKQKYLYS